MKRKTTADLGIDLPSNKEQELFEMVVGVSAFWQTDSNKHCHASLPNKSVRRISAVRRQFLRLAGMNWFRLLDEAHYVRYDFSTATQLLDISEALKRQHGNVTSLVAQSKTPRDVSAKLQERQDYWKFG